MAAHSPVPPRAQPTAFHGFLAQMRIQCLTGTERQVSALRPGYNAQAHPLKDWPQRDSTSLGPGFPLSSLPWTQDSLG
jgi:hypothetical protein